MATNFTITTKSGGTAQIMSGEAMACVDQAPTGSWVEVAFGTLKSMGGGGSERVCHIASETPLRVRVSDTQPAAPDVGSLVLAERTIGLPSGTKLWIK